MNTSANSYIILERLDCYVARITANKAIKGGSLSKNEYI